jgi:hypothetical protein
MYLDFQKDTVLNHNKINENGWKSSKYKYDKFGDLNTCCVNNGSVNLNHSNSVNKQLTYSNNNMKHTCNTIVKTLCAIFDNESNTNKLIQKIKRGNDVSNEINPYLIEMETMYNNKFNKNKNVDYENMKKWVKNKTKKIEYFKKELELYKQLYQMLQSLSPLTLSDVEDDYYDSNSSYYNMKSNNDTNILELKSIADRHTCVDTVELLPEYQQSNTAAAIRVVGEKIYISIRGCDKIVTLTHKDGVPGAPVLVNAEGKSPRDIHVIGDFLFSANENSDCVTAFRVTESGLQSLNTQISVPKPLCIVFR